MTTSVSLLFLNAGRRVELIRRFRDAFKALNVEGRIVTTDIQPMAPALYSGDVKEILPHTREVAFPEKLKDLCRRENVKMIVPLIDPDLLPLSRLKPALQSLGVKALVSDEAIIQICRDKEKTWNFLKEKGFLTMSHFSLNKPAEWTFPMIIKPRDGSSSEDVYRVTSGEEVKTITARVNNPLLQSCLEGEEITIDVFSDESRQPLLAVPRKRLKVRAGEVAVGRVERDAALEELCCRIAKELGTIGLINIQIIRTKTADYVIEINPRYGGGCPLSMAAGAPFAEWTIQMALGQSLNPEKVSLKDRTTMMRFDESIFFSPDELLV